MKLLVIANDIGLSAPGIVYKSLIEKMLENNEITIISPQISRSSFNRSKVKVLKSWTYYYIRPRLVKYSFKLFGYNLYDKLWHRQQLMALNSKEIKDVDFILSFMSNYNLNTLLLGLSLSKKYKKKWGIYSVDAVPPPPGWGMDDKYRKEISIFVNTYIEKADVFFSANKQMLDYQLSMLKNKVKCAEVLYTPIRQMYTQKDQINTSKTDIFLFTGGIYGPRKKGALLDGFRMYLKTHSDAELVFVGSGDEKYFNDYKDLLDNGNIKLYGFTPNLNEFYEKATVLIDINAYFDNDVFLSSKIVNYLPLMLPIICITGNNSPARNIFKDDDSIIHCKHDVMDVYNALEKAVKVNVVFEERQKYIEQFSASSVASKLELVIKNYCCPIKIGID